MQIVYKDHSPCSLNHLDLCSLWHGASGTKISPHSPAHSLHWLWLITGSCDSIFKFLLLLFHLCAYSLRQQDREDGLFTFFAMLFLKYAFVLSISIQTNFGGNPWKTNWEKKRFDTFLFNFLFHWCRICVGKVSPTLLPLIQSIASLCSQSFV